MRAQLCTNNIIYIIYSPLKGAAERKRRLNTKGWLIILRPLLHPPSDKMCFGIIFDFVKHWHVTPVKSHQTWFINILYYTKYSKVFYI